MTTRLDFQRLSTFLDGLVDQKVQPLAMSLTWSSGYIKGLVAQATAAAAASATSATDAQSYASDADQSAITCSQAYIGFTSSYGGIQATDPTRSVLNNPFNTSAFYVNSTNGRVRYVTAIDGQGNPTWADITAVADPTSARNACTGYFLALAQVTNQKVTGPVQFTGAVLVPAVTSWTSQQAVGANDVNTKTNALSTAISQETTRAGAAETAITASLNSKTGALTTTIAQETTRAEAAESALTTSLNTKTNALSTAISQETTRATAAEGALSTRITAATTAISAETTRATQAEAALNTAKVNRTDFQVVANANGTCETRPSGVVEQWGYIGNNLPIGLYTVTFPVPFASTNYVPHLAIKNTDSGSGADNLIFDVVSLATDSMQIQLRQTTSGTGLIDGVFWRAIFSPATLTSASGGGNTSGGGTVGGGGVPGGGCIPLASYLPSGKQAGSLVVGDDLLLLNRDGTDGYHHEDVEKLRYATQPTYRLTTQSGITLLASDSTPITLRDGSVVSLLNAKGKDVPVLDNGTFRWEPIVGIDYVADMEVVLITAGDGTYAAGEYNNNRYIFTHNTPAKQ